MCKLSQIIEELQTEFFQREEVIRGLILGLLSGNNVLLLGPPGTGKSQLVNRLVKRMSGIKHFTYLMTRFTRPDEIIGPVSLKGLEQDEFTRVLKGRLADVQVAFLDEIFNSNSGCLNAVLGIMNEKQVLNGTALLKVPLVMLVGAANELPRQISGDLNAFYDRFLLRFQVDYVTSPTALRNMVSADIVGQPETMLTMEELDHYQQETARVKVPGEVLSRLITVVIRLRQQGLGVSDRRLKQSVGVLKALAFINGRNSVSDEDFKVLKDVFWAYPTDREKVSQILEETQQPVLEMAADIASEARRLFNKVSDVQCNFGEQTEIGARLLELKGRLAGLAAAHQNDRELALQVEGYSAELEGLLTEIMQAMVPLGRSPVK